MADHFNGLTPSEAERLALLIEECAEVQQAACKILRHGFESENPTAKGHSPTNRETLEREIGDLSAAMDMVCQHDVDPGRVAYHANAKRENVKQWMHHRSSERE